MSRQLAENLAGRAGVVAPPGHDLVGAAEGEIGLIELPRLFASHIDDFKVDVRGSCRRAEGFAVSLAQAQQGPFEAEEIEERSSILQPQVRRAASWTGARRVGVRRIRRRGA